MAKLPWTHNCILLEKIKYNEGRSFEELLKEYKSNYANNEIDHFYKIMYKIRDKIKESKKIEEN